MLTSSSAIKQVHLDCSFYQPVVNVQQMATVLSGHKESEEAAPLLPVWGAWIIWRLTPVSVDLQADEPRIIRAPSILHSQYTHAEHKTKQNKTKQKTDMSLNQHVCVGWVCAMIDMCMCMCVCVCVMLTGHIYICVYKNLQKHPDQWSLVYMNSCHRRILHRCLDLCWRGRICIRHSPAALHRLAHKDCRRRHSLPDNTDPGHTQP